MAYQLPADVLISISDFLQSDQLSRVCQRTRDVLQRRHVLCSFETGNVQQKVSELTTEPTLHTLTAQCVDLGNGDVKALAALKHAPSLRSITLHVNANQVGHDVVEMLAELKAAPALTSLTLVMNVRGSPVCHMNLHAGDPNYCMPAPHSALLSVF
jgi:hypothetical protein|eukprot:CAMPEP_0174286234 /NCGR_PEP_ID=MMETSP0809-20121228/10982_1 /TAXON_ID=73025 ORGANISM="Eutreptiella gymnastica-like, Strain CCMP1594" /NCGR_SAMPLE_ID=MMETSP0809 /ASSEMBLY_ACC=CAM_ASM_000658 /LENGTH=155 /DNA_ID=CAMNT_0015382219 /DNA_START=17 /DNA_END=484 /DNA_ORIENTATION=+